MIDTTLINDLLQKCNIEVAHLNSLLMNSTDKEKNKMMMKHLASVNKIIQSLQFYKQFDKL
jgi:hypothetical protein